MNEYASKLEQKGNDRLSKQWNFPSPPVQKIINLPPS
jgi:hypothetical protein